MRRVVLRLAFLALAAAGCGESTAPPERYLAEVQDLEVPAVAASSDTVHVRFTFTLHGCSGLEAVEIRQTYTGAEFAVWGRGGPPFVECRTLVMQVPVQVDYIVLPHSRAPEFEVVVRQEQADLVRTIAYP